MSESARAKIKKVVDELGGEIESGEDALRVFGRLDALASAILSYTSPKAKKITRATPLPEVLRRVAKTQGSAQGKLLKRAARKAKTLLAIAEEVSYGELDPEDVSRAEEARSELCDDLYAWIEGCADDK